jgi:orotidine-5'-phosphate decarboxylase
VRKVLRALLSTAEEAMLTMDPVAGAQQLRTAMQGFGKDDKALIHVLVNNSNQQVQAIRQAYTQTINRNLIADLRSECKGAYEDALVGLVMTPAEYEQQPPIILLFASCQCFSCVHRYDAHHIHEAFKGVGCDKKASPS